MRSDAWFARQLAHARECIAQADKVHTPAEIEAARTALSAAFQAPQCELFSDSSATTQQAAKETRRCG